MRRANDFIVGLVIIVGIVAVVAATLWVQQADVGRRREDVTARFRDVGGLQVGNAVVIRGVRAGRVRRIELGDDGWVKVDMTLDPAISVPQNPVVLANSASLFGEWQVTIMPRSALPQNPDVEAQIAEAARRSDVIPGATLPDIAQLTGVAGRIADDVATVAERVQVAFNDTAAGELRRSIRNVDAITGQLTRTVRTQSNNLNAVMADVRVGAQSLVEASASLQRTLARVDSSTSTGEVSAIVADAGEAAKQLRETSVELRAIARSLSESQEGVTVAVARLDSVTTKVNSGQGSLGLLVNSPSLYKNSDSLLVELRALVADIRANPKRYVSVSVF